MLSVGIDRDNTYCVAVGIGRTRQENYTMIVWIHKTDLDNYRSLMGTDVPILDERELDVQVQFSDDCMRTWVQVGYWYSFN